jgi:hypothetical protein
MPRFTRGERNPGTRWIGIRAGLNMEVREKILEIEPPVVQSIGTILTDVPQPLNFQAIRPLNFSNDLKF